MEKFGYILIWFGALLLTVGFIYSGFTSSLSAGLLTIGISILIWGFIFYITGGNKDE